jgi:hypothetical protein
VQVEEQTLQTSASNQAEFAVFPLQLGFAVQPSFEPKEPADLQILSLSE